MANTSSVYEAPSVIQANERHTIAILVDNEPGVLARVVEARRGRGEDGEGLHPRCRALALGKFIDGSNVSGFDLKPSMTNCKHIGLDRLRKVRAMVAPW